MNLRVDNEIISLKTIKLKIIDIIVWNFVNKLKNKTYLWICNSYTKIFNLFSSTENNND